MPAPYPVVLPQPFAAGASGSDRNTIPNAPLTTQRASFQLGFPPLVMLPVVAGGKPMLGPDMNGVLYMLSSHSVYAQTGQPYRWNAAVVAALGGYAVGTVLGSTDGKTLWYCIVDGTTTDPDASGAGWVAMYSYGITNITGLTGAAPRVLTLVEACKSVIVLTGTLTANQQVVLPAQQRRWLVVNATTGAFQTTVKTAAGSGVVVPPGGFNAPVEVWGDGTNIYNVVAPVNLNVDQAPSALSIAQRTNSGYLYATYFNQSSGLENFAMSAMYADAGDGFHRKISPANVQAQMNIANFPGQVSNAQVPQSAVTQYAAAVLASAALTGSPTAPTQSLGTANSLVATTAFANPGGSLAANGWQRLPSGLIIQWGNTGGIVANGSVFIGFSVAFPSQCFTVVSCGANAGGNDQPADAVTSIASTGFTQKNGSTSVTRAYRWMAFGF